MTTPVGDAAGGGGMPGWLKWLLGGGIGSLFGAGLGAAGSEGGLGGILESILGGKGKIEQVPTLSREQQSALKQVLGGLTGPGGGLQYFMDILGNNPQAFAQFEAPALRQFNEQIIPGIAERFSGVGGQRSSAFPQALSQAAAGLTEQLSAQRAGLRQNAAQSLLGAGLGTQSFENVYRQGSPGLLGYAAQGLGQAAPSLFGL